MAEKLLFQGAEAHVLKRNKSIIKERKQKSYRHPILDIALRTRRTRKEIKLLEKAAKVINVPRVLNSTRDTIVMEEIKGKNLAQTLDKLKNKTTIAKKIGIQLAKLHDSGIIHGDLTTSNMIYSEKKLYFIDFGLGYESQSIEDKSVDLHVLKEALVAKHPNSMKNCFKAILKGYSISKNHAATLKRLSIVEKRGRYKQQY